MTCIAAAIDNDGTVYMGADKVGVDDYRVHALASPKVLNNNGFLIGAAGSMRVVQIAHYVFQPPEPTGNMLAFMVTKFVATLRACMKEHGGEINGEEGESMNGTLLVARAGRLFQVDSTYAVIETAEPYNAIGCACREARSAMHARRKSKARAMVEVGLNAAAAYDINIRPPFTIDSI